MSAPGNKKTAEASRLPTTGNTHHILMKNNDSFCLVNALGLPVIESAGGLVCNDSHHILLMFKRGKWDMPKGRVEPIDSREESALREVQEETGLNSKKLVIQAKLVAQVVEEQ